MTSAADSRPRPVGYLIAGGTVLTPDGPAAADVLIENGRVAAVGPDLPRPENPATEAVDASGLVVGPGLVDLHAHLREPGEEWKEDIASGSAAAVAGGYTALLAMPNTDPPVDAGHLARYVTDRGRTAGLAEVVPAGCVTKSGRGKSLARLDEMFEAGVRLFTDDGRTVADAGLLRRAMEYVCDRGAVVAQHAEDEGLARGGHMHEGEVSSLLGMYGLPAAAETVTVARDLTLAEMTGARYHIQHVSAAASVTLIREAKDKGLPVTAEVAPHHLVFTHRQVKGMDPVYKMYPPLRAEQDRAALAEALADGTIDAVATDHAPHAAHEKDVPFEEAPRGVTGLETALAAVRTALDPDPVTLFLRMSVTPAAIAGLPDQGQWIRPGSPANLTAVDWDEPWTPAPPYHSKSSNNPFTGRPLTGRVRYTFYRGRPTYDRGRIPNGPASPPAGAGI